MTAHDPISAHECGHLYLLAQPEAAPSECLVDFLERRDAPAIVNQTLNAVRAVREGPSFEPDLMSLPNSTRRAEGTAFTTLSLDYTPYERTALDLEVREDGGVRLTCGAGVTNENLERFMHEAKRRVPRDRAGADTIVRRVRWRARGTTCRLSRSVAAGARLAQDNPATLCHPCRRRTRHNLVSAPEVPLVSGTRKSYGTHR
jgi:hypothetical protein